VREARGSDPSRGAPGDAERPSPSVRACRGLHAEAEIKNVAVEPSHRRRGIGRALIAAVNDLARDEGRSTLVVGTAAADVANLRLYQRLGFRMRSIERDAFTEAAGYEPSLSIDGMELRDRVWLDLPLSPG
jgi:ribosomal protein S18 acetylase RimI-like enzyme